MNRLPRCPDMGKAEAIRVSVIIPAYNSARWLGEAIESVLGQTFHEFELIVVDDGSTDNTSYIARAFTDPRIRYLHQHNKGLSAARNAGIRESRAEYVALLDADDIFKPNKLELQVSVLDQRPALALVTCGFDVLDERGATVGEQRPWLAQPKIDLQSLLFVNPVLPSTLVVRRSSFESVGLFDETLRRYEDWEFSLRLAASGHQFGYIKEVLVEYRRHGSNLSTAPRLVHAATEDAEKFLTRHMEEPALEIKIGHLKQKVLGNLYLDAAARWFSIRNGKMGAVALAEAFSHDPTLLDGTPPHWVTSLCSHALGGLVADTRSYIECIAEHAPVLEGSAKWTGRKLGAQLLAADAWRSMAMKRRSRARLQALLALATDRSNVGDRGLIKLAFQPW